MSGRKSRKAADQPMAAAASTTAAATTAASGSSPRKAVRSTGDADPVTGAAVLPASLEEMRTKVFVGPRGVTHTHAVEDPHAYAALGVDNSLHMDQLRKHFRVRIIESDAESITFDMIGIDAPIANAIRRILLSEIPTMAIEKVYLYQNTSIIADEVLAHRLGLVPILADPRLFKTMKETGNVPSDENTLVFTIQAECKVNPAAGPFATDASEKFINSTVLSSELKWVPQGTQAERFADNPIRPVHDDIVLAKMRPGQSIEAELWCEKNIGKEHAKWSPVATASYRLMPDIRIKKQNEVVGPLAEELVAKCPAKVFDIEDLAGGGKRAVVARPRNCTMCRECIREPEWEQRVELRRIRDHFIFSVESVGMYEPAELVRQALMILKQKCSDLLEAIG